MAAEQDADSVIHITESGRRNSEAKIYNPKSASLNLERPPIDAVWFCHQWAGLARVRGK